MLERVPTDKLAWKPHAKSMSLGVLALHVAASPAVIAGWAAQDETVFAGDETPPPSSTAGGNTMMTMPKASLVRTIVLNHWYHHRGQLSVYLRLLDVPVPSIYGPSADENPFAAKP